MKIVSTLALALALGGVSLAVVPATAAKKEAAAATPEAPKRNFSKGARNSLAAAQKAITAKDAATAATEIEKARAASETPDDKYMVAVLSYQLAQMNNDKAATAQALDAMIASGVAEPSLLPQLYIQQAQTAWDAKDYAKAASSLEAAQAAGNTNMEIIPMLVVAQSNVGQTLKAMQTVNAAIDKQAAAGQPVPVEWYERGVDIGYRAKSTGADAAAINALTLEISQKWVAAYPTKRNWNTALRVYSDTNKLDAETRIDMFRLLRHADALSGDVDYREYAIDVYRRYPQEANMVLQEGSSKGIVNLTGRNDATDVIADVKPRLAADKASLPASDKAARAAANGRAALNTADAYVGYGEFAKAADLYKVALTKGGVDANLVNLRLGAALAQANDAAGAKAAFAQVQGPRKALADFWVIHLSHPTTA
jgi:tetratricopeptide (TPR) repeat protein